MATLEFIQNRVAGATKKIEKLQSKISRIREVEARGWADPNPYYYSERDLRYALSDLQEAEKSLADWQAKLDEAQAKAASRDVKAILDFLAKWRSRMTDWYGAAITEYYQAVSEIRALRKALGGAEYGSDQYKALHDRADELSQELQISLYGEYAYKDEQERYRDHRTGEVLVRNVKVRIKVREGKWEYAREFLGCRNADEAKALLDKTLMDESNAKYDDIVGRTVALIGKITDASGLRISPKGNLDGLIVGEHGTAKVHTVGAGGYAIQCFHFRTLIHKVADAEEDPEDCGGIRLEDVLFEG